MALGLSVWTKRAIKIIVEAEIRTKIGFCKHDCYTPLLVAHVKARRDYEI